MLAVIEVDRDMKVTERVEEVRVETVRGESGVMEWNMIIDDVSPSDAGLYQCQVKYISYCQVQVQVQSLKSDVQAEERDWDCV